MGKTFNSRLKRKTVILSALLIIAFIVTAGLSLQALDLAEQVSTHTLDNNMKVIMVERGEAPVIHFRLMFDVGAVDEPEGLGGIAHMVEHMAFKGTTTIGSENWEKESEYLENIDEAADAYFSAREKEDISEERLTELEENFKAAREAAQEWSDSNPLQSIFDEHGARGYNAATGYDHTSYFLTLPSNRLELFARVKADVIQNAVFRYFYEEVDVVKEERRQRNEDEPTGYLMENFLSEAYSEHYYGRPLIGSMEEIEGYRRQEAINFWEEHYHPNRAVLVMSGDVNPDEDIEIIEKYFGRLESEPETRIEIPEEPEQQEERRTNVTFDAEPQIFMGFHKPTYPDEDAYAMDAVSAILGRGRTSRLHRRLVTEEEVAVEVDTYSSYPGFRYPNLFAIHVITRSPHTPEDVEDIIYEEIEKLKEESVSDWELEKVRNQVRADYIRELDSSEGLAFQLAFHEHFLDGWENMMEYPEQIEKITSEDIQRAAEEYLVEDNRTVAILEAEEGGD